MIIKLRTKDAGWEYFNCFKGVKVRRLTKEQVNFVWSNKDENYIIINTVKEHHEFNNLTLINIYGNQKIYTDDVVYLLNDEGKTIEKLN